MKQNLHTHSTFCDGKSTIKEMIRSALIREFDVLGFSGHSFTGFDPSYCMSDEGIIDYLDEVTDAMETFTRDPELAKAIYAPDVIGAKDLRILLGIEQDLYSSRPALRKEQGLLNPGHQYGTFDYIIGSTHALRIGWDELEEQTGLSKASIKPDTKGIVSADNGLYIYVDYGADALRWAIDNVFHGDPMALAEAYFSDESRIVSDTDCDMVGHFDLLLKFNEKERIFDESAPRFIAARDKALEQIFSDFKKKERRPLFEINTGAMARGYRSVPYPSQDTLNEIRKRGGQLVINSDCHNARYLDYGFNEARKMALDSGFIPELIEVPGGELEIFI